jgi:hypothetical protein
LDNAGIEVRKLSEQTNDYLTTLGKGDKEWRIAKEKREENTKGDRK